MIDEIHVAKLALIREASFCPSRGLTVLTGETGAGKTALLFACKLLAGDRADRTAVREGEQELLVEGRFFFDAEQRGGAAEGAGGADVAEIAGAHAASGERELVVSRRVGADGRSRASINGSLASAKELALAVSPHLDLCSQHEHQALMKTANHLALLDAFAGEGVAREREAYERAYDAACDAAEELARVREAGQASSARLDEARFTLRQIDAVGLGDESEYDSLVERLGKAEHAEALCTAANTAHEALSGDAGALDALDTAASALEQASRYDDALAGLAASIREAGYVLEDVSRDALDYRDSVDFDADELAQAQERMAALQGLLRSFGPRMADVIAVRDEAAELVSLVDDADARLQAAEKALAAAEEELAQAASALDGARRACAPQLSAQVSAVMERLEMGSAALECSVEPLPRESWTRRGPHKVEFLFRPGAGMQARPLARIASGGEVSRVMLAIKTVLGRADEVDTLVFDEIDAGVGGATAVALAEVLADVAKTHQLIVVTHLAQVAAVADTHYVVRKTEGDVPETQLVQVDGDDRVAELARMLSGNTTEASLAHARELLLRRC